MPINIETHSNVSVILAKDVHAKLIDIAKKDKRSVSSLIAIIVDKYLEEQDRKEP